MSQGNGNAEDKKTIWVGDIEKWMDENYLRGLFKDVGSISSVKIIRDKNTNLPMGYGFVEFTSHDIAARVLQLYSNAINPNTNKPFRLNWGVYGGRNNERSNERPERGDRNDQRGDNKDRYNRSRDRNSSVKKN